MKCRPMLTTRRGAIVVFACILAVVMMALLAFSIDVGFMYTMQSRLERSVDAAALAGAGVLVDGNQAASDQALEYLVRNPLSGTPSDASPESLSQLKAQLLADAGERLQIESILWDPSTKTYTASTSLPNALRVSLEQPDLPLFFGRVLGRETFAIRAEAIATYQPRDILLVLDLSASMNDDSELRSIGKLSQQTIEQNLFEIWQELGSPTYGLLDFEPVYVSSSDKSVVKEQLGLTNEPYPYPSGSWNDFISYVMNDGYVDSAGYRKKYGMLTLINYWLQRKPRYSQTPDLWKVSAQPVTAVKDAVDVFLEFIQMVDTDDRIGLSVYNSASGDGTLEAGLTSDFALVSTTTRQRQAGHYHSYTNIAAGMRVGREELESNARPGAFKMLVVLTDGKANWYSGGYSTSAGRQAVLDEAALCKDAKIPVLTISLGAGADTSLMDQVASQTDGIHFNVPGGQSVEQYKADLMDVFRQIAGHRPLKLVK